MRDTGAVPPASVMTEDQTASVDQQGLATNRFALSFYWSNQLGALSKASGQTLEILRPPSVKGTAKDAEQYYKSSMYYSASARTKHPVEAQQFIDFMANSIEAGEIGLADRASRPTATCARQSVPSSVLPMLQRPHSSTRSARNLGTPFRFRPLVQLQRLK